jgi:hypothetical protein
MLMMGRAQCAAALGRDGERRQKSGLSWCEVSRGERDNGPGTFLSDGDDITVLIAGQGGVPNRITSRSKYGTKKPKTG